jgi:hypothetical protein
MVESKLLKLEANPILASFHAYDQEEINLYSHATNYSLLLWDIENRLRNDEKWHLDDYKSVAEYVEKLREFFYDMKEQYHLPEN